MLKQRKISYPFFFSLLIHFAACLLFINFYFIKTTHQDDGTAKTPVISAYFQNEILKSVRPEERAEPVSRRAVRTEKSIRTKKSVRPKERAEPASRRAVQQSSGGAPIPALLQQLHDAIAAKEVYPATAKMLGQSGSTTVSFVLYPDGHVTTLALKQSSGIPSLDAAALQAVNAAAPFSDVEHYVTMPAQYSIQVSFEVDSED